MKIGVWQQRRRVSKCKSKKKKKNTLPHQVQLLLVAEHERTQLIDDFIERVFLLYDR